MKILLVEDNQELSSWLSRLLGQSGYVVESAFTGEEAEHFLLTQQYDAILLDLMLPGMKGQTVLKHLRDKHNDVPVLIISAQDKMQDIIEHLNLGADDYLAKPYEPRELALRLEASLRRVKKDIYEIGDLALFEAEREVYLSGEKIELTKIEYEILKLLMQNPGKAFSRAELAWSLKLDDKSSRTIDTHLSNLRQKLGDNPKEPKFIQSVWGIGYKFIC